MSYDKKKKVTVLDMNKYMDKSVRVKFMGGREVSMLELRLRASAVSPCWLTPHGV